MSKTAEVLALISIFWFIQWYKSKGRLRLLFFFNSLALTLFKLHDAEGLVTAQQRTVFGQRGVQAALSGRQPFPAPCLCQPTAISTDTSEQERQPRRAGGAMLRGQLLLEEGDPCQRRDGGHGCSAPGWGPPPTPKKQWLLGAALGWRHQDVEWQQKTSKK